MIDHEDVFKSAVFAGYAEDGKIVQTLVNLAYTLNASELSDHELRVVLHLFSSRGLEQLLDLTEARSDAYRWSEFEIGNTREGDVVRVRLDAYETENGKLHNGLVGIIESVNSGRVDVRYLGRYADTPQTHPREKLEILKKV